MEHTPNKLYSCNWNWCPHFSTSRAELQDHMESEHLTDQAIDSVCKVSTKEWESWEEVNMRHGPQYIAESLMSILEKIEFRAKPNLNDLTLPRDELRKDASTRLSEIHVPSPPAVTALLSRVTDLTRTILAAELSKDPKTPPPPAKTHNDDTPSLSFTAYAAMSSPSEYAGSPNASPPLSQLVRGGRPENLNHSPLLDDDDDMEIDPNDPPVSRRTSMKSSNSADDVEVQLNQDSLQYGLDGAREHGVFRSQPPSDDEGGDDNGEMYSFLGDVFDHVHDEDTGDTNTSPKRPTPAADDSLTEPESQSQRQNHLRSSSAHEPPEKPQEQSSLNQPPSTPSGLRRSTRARSKTPAPEQPQEQSSLNQPLSEPFEIRRSTRATSKTPAPEQPPVLPTRVLRSSSMTPQSKQKAKAEFFALKKRERGIAPLTVARRRYTAATPTPGEAPDAPIAIPDTEDEEDMEVPLPQAGKRKRTRSGSRAPRTTKRKRTRSATPAAEELSSSESQRGRHPRAKIQVETIVEEEEPAGELEWPEDVMPELPAPEVPTAPKIIGQPYAPSSQGVMKKFRTGFLDLSQPSKPIQDPTPVVSQATNATSAGQASLPTPRSSQEPPFVHANHPQGDKPSSPQHSPLLKNLAPAVSKSAQNSPLTPSASLRNPLSQLMRIPGASNQAKTTPSSRRTTFHYTILSKRSNSEESTGDASAASENESSSKVSAKSTARSRARMTTESRRQQSPREESSLPDYEDEDEYSQLQLLTQAPCPSQSFDDSQ